MGKLMKETKNIVLRPANERGHANHGWLDSYFTFSFADYYDPDHMDFRALRVINEDVIEPGMGFGAHPHQNMEIFTYVIEGSLQHKDSMGHESVIKSNQVQKITAGKGIVHSEFNASSKEKVHLLQIWIMPDKKDLTPSYEEFSLPKFDEKNPLLLLGSPDGGKNIVRFNQDVYVYRGLLKEGKDYKYNLKSGRGVWIQIVKGKLDLNGTILTKGDGVSVENETHIDFKAHESSEFLLFDLK